VGPSQPTPKSLIVDLLSTLPAEAEPRSMPVRALVAAGELFGIAANALRVALARLLAAGVVERDERGRYRLGPAGRAVGGQVAAWRRAEERTAAWDGGWVAAHTAGLPRGRDARRHARALRLLGLRSLAPGLEVRPDNLAGGAPGVRGQLRALGLPPHAPVFRMDGLEPPLEARARGLWDVEALRRGYAEGERALAESAGRLAHLPPEEAMAETFLVGGRVLRQIVLDPLLPEPIAPVAERRALVRTMREYDRLGRSCWAPFLAAHGAPHRRGPVDLRMSEGIAMDRIHEQDPRGATA